MGVLKFHGCLQPGEEVSLEKAFRHYQKAARYGSDMGAFNLGVAHWRGLGTDIDLEKALEVFVEAAEATPYARQAVPMLEGKTGE